MPIETLRPMSCRIVSAIPGRVRLQFSSASVDLDGLSAVADELRGLPGVDRVDLVPDASSLIVNFNRDARILRNFATQILVAAQRALPLAMRRATRNDVKTELLPTSTLTARRTAAPDDRLLSALRLLGRRAAWKWRKSDRRPSNQAEKITAGNMPPEKPRGIKGLILPTLAVTLAATEVLPLAITGAALALASIPIFERAAKRTGQGQLTVDQLDFANVLLLALEGGFLPASAITWLIGMSELIRGETVQRAQRRTARTSHAAVGSEQQRAQLLAELLKETLSNTQSQENAVHAANGLTYPLAGLGVVMALVWRDAGVFIDVFKPRSDFESATRVSVPTALLNTITHAQRHGVHFASAAAVEALAKADAFLFASLHDDVEPEQLVSFVEALLQRGARCIVLPTGRRSEAIRKHAEVLGRHGNVFIQDVIDARTVEALQARRLHVALVSGDEDADADALSASNVRVLLSSDPDAQPDGAAIVRINSLKDLPFAQDASRQAMRIVSGNMTIAAGAATFNLANGLMQLMPAPVSSLVNTLVIGVTAVNSERLASASGELRIRPRSRVATVHVE